MKAVITKTVTYGVGVATLAGMVVYLIAQRDVIDSLRSISVLLLLLLLFVTAAGSFNYGGRFRLTCAVFGVELTYWQAVGLAVTNSMLNYAIPLKGGMVLRAAYMKQQFGLSFTDYGALLASSQLLSVLTAGIAGLAVAIAAHTAGLAVPATFFAVFGAATVGSTVVFATVDLVAFDRLRPAAAARRLDAFSKGFTRWRRQPRATLRYVGSAVVSIALGGLRLGITFTALGVSAPILTVMLVAAAVWLVGTLPVTPGNLGITEGATSLAAGLLGIDPRVALLAALIDRAASIVVVFGMGLPFSHTLMLGRRSRQNTAGPPDD